MNHQTKQVERNSPIAIVGMGIVFPGADRPEDFWNVVVHGQCKAEQIASDRWPVDPKLLFEPRGIRSDSVYSLTACLIDKDWRPDPTGIPLPPDVNVSSLDPVFGLAIHAAAAAWRNARTEKLNRDRVSVILGNIALPTESTAAWSQELFSWELAGRSEQPRRLTEPNSWNRDPIAFPARLISQALRLGGRSFTLDAACASSLYALKLGMDELRDGRADAVLAGGLSRPDCLYTQMGFAQLHALSHNGLPRPFDESGDGLVVGEGAGIFLLKRLDDALAQGDKILGVLRAVGLSNDVSGALLAPSSEGQLRAMKAAYEECGLSPDQMDTIECHATGTPVGDSEEFRSLQTLWENTDSDRNICVLGSVKSNIGHGLTSAGAAGLAKLLLAFEYGVFPPTAGFQKPRVTLDIDGSPFRILKKAEPWQRRSPQTPRRAALSGFGFGGINAHLIVEEYLGQSFEKSSDPDGKQEFEVAVSGLGGRIGPHEGLGQLARALVHGQFDELEHPLHWYGVGTSEHFDGEDSRHPKVVGYLAETVDVPIGKFRIPPAELQEILPQQAMILNAAYEAASQAGWLAKGSKPRLRTAVLLGVSLDQGTNHFQLRWALTDPGKDHHQPSAELKEARDTLGPPLTANRVMGNLASIAASRLAREFRLGGPSFTVSEGPDAGLTALETAFHWIASGVIDEAIVGAVDLTSDLRHSWSQWLASKKLNSRLVICDSALAVIISRKSQEPINRALAYVSLTHNDKKNAIAPAKCQPDSIPELYGGAVTSLIGWVRQCLGILYRIKPSKEFPWIGNDSKIIERAHYWMAEKTGIPREILTDAASSDYLFRIRENLGLERSELPSFHYRSSAGIFLLSARDRDGLIRETRLLANWFTESEHESKSPSELADLWWNRQNNDETFGDERLALVLWKVSEAIPLLKQAVDHIQTGTYHGPKRFASQSDYIYFPIEQSRSGELAFVFPGMGSGFAGMGQEISARWPSAFDQICSEWSCPETELLPGLFWNMDFPDRADHHCDLIFGQAALGMAISTFVRRFGVEPNAMMGLSLGESVQLLASGVWEDHDELWQRMRESSLFKSELAGECRAARRYWELSDEEPVDWLTVVVPKPLDQVKAAISSEPRVNILIIDAPNEVVLGGQREAVERVLRQIKCRKVPVGIVSTMHSPLALSVREEYLKLHTLAIHDPSPLRLYSAVFGRSYLPTSKNCAEAITGLSYQTVDFVSLVEQAYRDGIRTFLEIGPGSSCSRMIQAILKDRPHRTIALTPAKGDSVGSLLKAMAELFAIGFGKSRKVWSELFGPTEAGQSQRSVSLRVGGSPIDWPTNMQLAQPKPVRIHWREPSPEPVKPEQIQTKATPTQSDIPPASFLLKQPAQSASVAQHQVPHPIALIEPTTMKPIPSESRITWPIEAETMKEPKLVFQKDHDLAKAMMSAVSATNSAHSEFQELWAEMMGDVRSLILMGGDLRRIDSSESFPDRQSQKISPVRQETPKAEPFVIPEETPRSLSRELCMTYGRGPIAPVFGKKFAEIDSYPTRVRLPDEPLMLVDRVTLIEGEPLSMTHGRIVTEHDVIEGDWYLDCNRIPVCIAVESGQADLMLSGYLGIDFQTRGLAMYRLLDAVVTFHDHMPGPGEVIVYDIKILNFFRQDETYLFRFAFDATVNGKPFLTMRDGCAGFFTPEHLAAGQGVVRTRTELQPQQGKRPADWKTLVPMTSQTVSQQALDALRGGDFVPAFGPSFANLPLKRPVTLPSGKMRLVDRVTELDPTGGRFGLGRIRAEFDIQPEAWFMTCHFVDDRVMPGTLMYECCLHTLRIFLLRMGWICEETPEVAMEPIPGVRSRLKCRGQVLESTKTVMYEIEIKELGYGPEPYCIADALMYADGKPIVDMRDMSLKYTGVTREMIEKLWENQPGSEQSQESPLSAIPFAGGFYPRESETNLSKPPARYTHQQILEFAEGEPWKCFGEPYRIYDGVNRKLARLPRPPFNFLHRITEVTGKPFEMVAGGIAVGEYDVHPEDWYFAQERSGRMPFTVLQEAALQVCGWLSSYVGSALTSATDLKYRNLGGSCRWHQPVLAKQETLVTKVKLTQLSHSAGMIIQHFHMEMVNSANEPVYSGTTYFGFFDADSLKNQVGIRGFQTWTPKPEDLSHSLPACSYPTQPPLPDQTLRMIDRITTWLPNGGPHGLGYVVGETTVKPESWFFDAHFYQDPVVPGSLGLESFIQLMKAEAVRRWGHTGQFQIIGIPSGTDHEWVYRGQVVPTDRLMTTKVSVTKVDDSTRTLWADGHLEVDGRYIYQMKKFAIRIQ